MSKLVPCNQCDAKISPNALACPHCGEPNPTQEDQNQEKSEPQSNTPPELDSNAQNPNLRQCLECENFVSKQAEKCPHCGADAPPEGCMGWLGVLGKLTGALASLLFGLLLLIFFIILVFS